MIDKTVINRHRQQTLCIPPFSLSNVCCVSINRFSFWLIHSVFISGIEKLRCRTYVAILLVPPTMLTQFPLWRSPISTAVLQSTRTIKITPSPHHEKRMNAAKQIESSSPKRVLHNPQKPTNDSLASYRKTLNHQIWHALVLRDWRKWEELFESFTEYQIPQDEVSYTLKLFGHLFSHWHPSENALLVLQEMKQAGMHPAIIKLNEGLLNSHFELQEIFCNGPTLCWQSLCRMSWNTAIKLQRRRKKRIRKYLESLEPNKVLRINKEDLHSTMAKGLIKIQDAPQSLEK